MERETRARGATAGLGPSGPGLETSASATPALLPAPRFSTRLRTAGPLQWLVAAASIVLPTIDIVLALVQSRGRRTRRS